MTIATLNVLALFSSNVEDTAIRETVSRLYWSTEAVRDSSPPVLRENYQLFRRPDYVYYANPGFRASPASRRKADV